MAMTADELRRLMISAPFHRMLKVELAEADPAAGRLTVRLEYDERYTISAESGAYHGGVIASLLDVAGTFCCFMAAGKVTPTADLRIDYLQPPVRCALLARAQLVRLGRGSAVADVQAFDDKGQLYAVARGAWRVPG